MTWLEVIHLSPFYELAAILLLAAVAGFIALRLHQPLIVAFLAVGLLAGPDLLGIVSPDKELVEILAQLGVALLLFMVGLKLDIKLVRTLGGVALATGLGQVIFTALIGFAICTLFGFSAMASVYIAVALTFSSTIIIVKLLSDKREIDSLHGRIALGFLIVQDIFVIFSMVVLSAFGMGEESASLGRDLLFVALKGACLLGFVVFFIAYIADPAMRRLASSPELMVTFAVAWAAALAAAADFLGFSIELGGLLAGVSLASTAFRDVISARLSSLRDFLLLFFFIAMGAQINLEMLGGQITPALVLSLFVLLGNPLIVMIIMGAMGYRKRTGFLAGLTVAQISEFSLIFVAMGITLGHIGEDMLALVTLVGLVTISLSTYMIVYSQVLYSRLEPILGVFERKKPYRETETATAKQGKAYDVILFGLGRYGSEIAKHCLDSGLTVLGLDFDPDVLYRARPLDRRQGFDMAYGDVSDPNLAIYLPIDKARWVVCAVPHPRLTLQEEDFRLSLLKTLQNEKYSGKIAMISHGPEETKDLEENGVDLVLTPFPDAAKHAVSAIMERNETQAE